MNERRVDSEWVPLPFHRCFIICGLANPQKAPRLLRKGVVRYFAIVGHYGGFDRLAALAVKEARRFYPEVKLTLLLPYHPEERPTPTPDGFDSTFYPPGMESVPRKIAIVRANRYVVDHVDYLIAYAWHPASNARELVEYAKRRENKGNLFITLIKPND